MLLPKVLEEKNRTDFSELLIWFYMQYKQYDMALIQAKALDRRMNLDGEIVFDLAEAFLNQEDFDVALEAYNYIISKGERNYFYIDANIQKLYVLHKMSSKEPDDLNQLDLQYEQIMLLLGQNKNTIILMKNYAHFKAFYMNDLIAAEDLLLKAMSVAGIKKFDLAECKMEYADVLLLQGRQWQSMLYLAQVEQDFKEHPIGHESKVKSSKNFIFSM